MTEHLQYTETLKKRPFPLDYREVGSALDRLAHSELALCLLARHLRTLKIGNKRLAICVFGSTGRGEFNVQQSDIDLMFIGFTQKQRNEILRKMVTSNSGLDFHGASDLLDRRGGAANAALNLRFPAIPEAEILEGDGTRRLQFLLEARPIFGQDYANLLIEQVIRRYGLEQKPKLRTQPEKLMEELDAFYERIAGENANRAEKMSDFFAKHFVVREFGQHLARLSLITAIYKKKDNYNSARPALSFASWLRRPNLLKLLFWTEPDFFVGRTISLLESNHSEELSSALVRVLHSFFPSRHEPASKPDAKTIFNRIVQRASAQYNDTLDLIFATDFHDYLKNAHPNVLNWDTDPHLQRITAQCTSLKQTLTCLGEALQTVFEIASNSAVLQKPFQGTSGLQAAIDSFLLHLK